MSRKHLNTLQKASIKERGRKVVEHPAASNQIRPLAEDRLMAANANIRTNHVLSSRTIVNALGDAK